MSFLSGIGDFFKNIFSGLLRAFKAFIDLALPIAKQIIIAQLKDIALQIVKKLQDTKLTNPEKRNEAFEEIRDYAATCGIKASDSLINTVLELALQTIKD